MAEGAARPPFFYTGAMGIITMSPTVCAVPSCRLVPGMDPVRVRISRRDMPQELSALTGSTVVTLLTLCAMHEAQFRQLGWLDERDKENGHV